MEKFKKTVDGIDFYSSKKFNEIDKVWITGIFKGCADGKFKSPKVLEDHPNIIGGVMNIGTKSTISNNINDEKIFIYFRKNWYTINDILELEKWKITFDSFYCNLYSNLEGVVYLSSIKVSIEDKFGEFNQTKKPTLISETLSPTENIYTNFQLLQNYNDDISLAFLQNSSKTPLDVLNFNYFQPNVQNKASMSLHLTNGEKQTIVSAFSQKSNQQMVDRLKALLH